MKIFPKHQTKNVRLLFFLRGMWIYLTGGQTAAARLEKRWQRMDQDERDYVNRRVNYYCKLDQPFDAGPKSMTISEYRGKLMGPKSNYFFDLYEHLRYFDHRNRLNYRFGDRTEVEAHPTFVKARPIDGDVANSVNINLDKIRHFNFIHDKVAFEDKQPRLVWRGVAKRKHRTILLENYFDHPLFDLGRTNDPDKDGKWVKPFMTIREQLKFKYILSIEGNDVATNLKWIMSSGSLCFQPKPKFETWYMEGTLKAGHHYVLVKDDYSDLMEKIEYYNQHPEEAKQIIANANAYVRQFEDLEREALIGKKVVEKYFSLCRDSV